MDDDDQGGVEPISREELEELRTGLSELREAVQGLNTARTPDERRRAREDVYDAEEDLDATARRLGVSRAKLEESITAARKAERRDELRPILEELIAEREAAAAAADDDGDDDGKGKGKGKGDDKGKGSTTRRRSSSSSSDDGGAGETEPVVDTEPVVPHWSERGFGSLVR